MDAGMKLVSAINSLKCVRKPAVILQDQTRHLTCRFVCVEALPKHCSGNVEFGHLTSKMTTKVKEYKSKQNINTITIY